MPVARVMRLFQSLYDVEVGEIAPVGVGIGLAIRSDQERTDGRHARRVARHERAPRGQRPRLRVEAIDLDRDLASLPHEQGSAPVNPGEWNPLRVERE